MANEENLIPFNKRTEKEQREIARKGGIASGETRRRKKSMREAMELIAEQPLTNAGLKRGIKNLAQGIDDDDIDMMLAATMGVFQAAIKGNVSAYEMIGKVIGDTIDDMEIEDDLSKSLRELRELGESL